MVTTLSLFLGPLGRQAIERNICIFLILQDPYLSIDCPSIQRSRQLHLIVQKKKLWLLLRAQDTLLLE